MTSILKIKRAVALVWQSAPGWTTLTMIVTALQSVVPLVLLYLIKLIVDTIGASLGSTDRTTVFSQILFLMMMVGLVMLILNIVAIIAELASVTLAQRVTDQMQMTLYRKAIEIDLETYESHQHQDILERAKWEAPYRPTQLLNNLTGIGQNAISLIAIAGLLISLHWSIIGVVLLASVPMMLIRVKQSKTLYKWRRHQTELERKAAYYGHLLLGDSSAKEIRLFNLGHLFIQRVREIRQGLFQEKVAISARQSATRLIAQALTSLIILFTYVMLIEQTLRGRFQLGDLVLYSQAFQRGQAALRDLITNFASLHENNLFLSDLYEFLELKPYVIEPIQPKLAPRPIRQGIVFQNVSFQYQNSARKAIDQVNFSIAPGEVVALVGENGCGKTTLVKLLCRLYDVSEGSITIDGINLKQFSIADLRRQISVIFQDYTHYQLTVEDNIWLGSIDQPATSERLDRAAQQANAATLIQQLPLGYETLLGRWFKGGEELSGGQWQKIALARAFLRDAQLVVLDEPTSAMDAKAEAEIFQKFRDLMRDRSALLITHRLSTVKLADRIYVMQHGSIVESGTHEQLIAQRGTYAHLFQTQASKYQ